MIQPILAARTEQRGHVESATVSETCAVFLALPALSFWASCCGQVTMHCRLGSNDSSPPTARCAARRDRPVLAAYGYRSLSATWRGYQKGIYFRSELE